MERPFLNTQYPIDFAGVSLVDTTLRDGEQAPGVVFTLIDKLTIAGLLEKAGIPEIEAGTPAMGEEEMESMRVLSTSGFSFKTLAWCRAMKGDLEKACRTKTNGIHISFPVSPIHLKAMEKSTDWVLKSISDMVPWALDHAEYVTIGAQDASRADAWFLEAFLSAVNQYKITRVRIADTVGILNPFSTYDLFKLLHQKFPDTCFEFHGHNDLGMATANALAACKGGATCIDTTVNGLGERAGNTSMEEFVMAMKLSMGVNLPIEPSCFAALSKYVSKASGIPIGEQKPITGSKVLKHESGIHTDMVLKCRETFQIVPAMWVGKTESEFIFGKHSGYHACKDFLQKNHLFYSENHCQDFTVAIKKKSARLKRALSVNEMIRLAKQ